MFIKYYFYTFLVWIGFKNLKEKITQLENKRVMDLLNDHLLFSQLYDAGVKQVDESKRPLHFITTPYLSYLLNEIKEGKTKQCESNTLLMDLFAPFKTHKDRMFFANVLTGPNQSDYSEIVRWVSPIYYWDLNVAERESVVKFWLKDIPEYSRVKYYLNKHPGIMLTDYMITAFFNILENGDEPGLLVSRFYTKCHSDEQIIATTKHLLQKHILADIKRRGITSRYWELTFYGTYDREKKRLALD